MTIFSVSQGFFNFPSNLSDANFGTDHIKKKYFMPRLYNILKAK